MNDEVPNLVVPSGMCRNLDDMLSSIKPTRTSLSYSAHLNARPLYGSLSDGACLQLAE